MLYNNKNQKEIKPIKKTTTQGQSRRSRPKGNRKMSRGQGK